MSGLVSVERRSLRQLPVSHLVIDAGALLVELAGAYDFGPRPSCQLLWHGMNDTYLVTAGATRLVVRVYRVGGHTDDEVGYELELLAHLASKNIAVSAPVGRRDGSLVHSVLAPEGHRQVAVFTHAAGRPLRWSDPRQSTLAGALAAAVHGGGDTFVTVRHRPCLDLDHLVGDSLAAVEPILAHRPRAWEAIVKFRSEIATRADEVVAEGLDWGPCHGDFGASNIHVLVDGAARVFDFDLCGPGWRAWDLVPARAMALLEKRRDIWERFIAGYRTTRFIADSDVAAVPLFHAISRLWSLAAHARNVAFRGRWRLSDEFVAPYIEFFRQWRESQAANASVEEG